MCCREYDTLFPIDSRLGNECSLSKPIFRLFPIPYEFGKILCLLFCRVKPFIVLELPRKNGQHVPLKIDSLFDIPQRALGTEEVRDQQRNPYSILVDDILIALLFQSIDVIGDMGSVYEEVSSNPEVWV